VIDNHRTLLFGLDLEDVLTMIPDGDRYERRVPQNTYKILDLVEGLGMRCTCFTVGNVARRYPELIRDIVDRGHEIGCHTNEHTTLDRLDPDGFRRDLEQNIEDLERCGAKNIRGFRAPVGSLTPNTSWAYEVLAELGFTYSSSVLSAHSPLYCWPGFGSDLKRMAGGVWELPISILPLPKVPLPYAGGTYLRVLPFPLIRWGVSRDRAANRPIVSHIHPYDVDTEQARFMHPELGNSQILNSLMYINRGRVLRRFEKLVAMDLRFTRFDEYVAALGDDD